MKKSYLFLFLIILLFVSACSTTSNPEVSELNEEADITDVITTKPESDDNSFEGMWNATVEELTINTYIYPDSYFISVLEDTEGKFWLVLSLWNQDQNGYTIENREEYIYDQSTGKWNKSDSFDLDIEKITFESNTLKIQETLPNSNTAEVDYSRGEAEMSIPDSVEFADIINQFIAR